MSDGEQDQPAVEPGQQEASLVLTKEERNWGMFCHVAVFAGLVVPFANIIAPLVLWLLKKEEMPFVDYNGKEVINFQLTMMIAVFVSWLLIVIVIGFLLLTLIGIFTLVVTVIGIIKASDGEYYRYPLTIRFLK